MFEINGISLTSSQYELLEMLVEKYDSNEEWDGEIDCIDKRYANGRIDDSLQVLLDKGLINAWNDGTKIHVTSYPQKGLDFIHDYKKHEADEAKRLKESRCHDFKVAAFGSIVGGILGLIGGCFSSEVMAFLKAIAS